MPLVEVSIYDMTPAELQAEATKRREAGEHEHAAELGQFLDLRERAVAARPDLPVEEAMRRQFAEDQAEQELMDAIADEVVADLSQPPGSPPLKVWAHSVGATVYCRSWGYQVLRHLPGGPEPRYLLRSDLYVDADGNEYQSADREAPESELSAEPPALDGLEGVL